MTKQKKNETLRLSMTTEEKEILKDLAKRSGVSVSELVRLTLVYQSIDMPKKKESFHGIKKSNESRTQSVYIQVTPTEKEAIKNRANNLGCTTSDLIRRSVLEQEIKKVEVDNKALKNIYHELAKQGTNLNQLMYWLNAHDMSAFNKKEVENTSREVRKAAKKANALLQKVGEDF